MFNTLSQSDKEMLLTWIINESEGPGVERVASLADFENIFANWAENKKDLYKVLGNKLIVEKEIYFEKDICELRDDLSKYWYSFPMSNFRDSWENWVYCSKATKDLSRYDKDCLYSLVGDSRKLIQVTTSHDLEVPNPNSKTPFKLRRGDKIMRFVGKVAKAYNINGYEAFATEVSKVLNQKKLKGTLSISIHPMDFLTMSDNTYDWNSCMSWIESGCYRQGTVEMMNSPIVVVAYLSGEDKMYNGWNSKKWRELFIVDRNIITGIKGYPYENSNLEKIVLNELKSLVEQNTDWRYESKITSWPDSNAFGSYITTTAEEQNVKFRFQTEHMYNDFGNKSCNVNSYFGSVLNSDTTYEINYSGQPQCMICGRPQSFDYEGYVIGDCCGEYIRCHECGCALNLDDGNYIERDGRYYCDDCLSEYETCPFCEGLIINERSTNVAFQWDTNWYTHYHEFHDDCFESFKNNLNLYIKEAHREEAKKALENETSPIIKGYWLNAIGERMFEDC